MVYPQEPKRHDAQYDQGQIDDIEFGRPEPAAECRETQGDFTDENQIDAPLEDEECHSAAIPPDMTVRRMRTV